MIKLRPDQFESVRHLFDGLWYHLNLFAVIEGKCPGQVFADNVDNPKAALIWEQVEGNCYLVGDSTNPEIADKLRAVIAEEIVPAGQSHPDNVELLINWHPDAWEDHFDAVLADIAPMRHLRKHFVIDSPPLVDWRTDLPADYALQLVGDQLLSRNELVNIDKIRGWGSGSHKAMKPLMGGGIGTVVLDGDHIVSWCMGDYAAGNAVEVGIHTDVAYRRKGLATLATAAMVETCLESGADYVGWHCWSSNKASAQTARKVGFRQTIEHPIYHAWYNPVDNQFVRGNMLKFEYGEPAKAVEEYAAGFCMIDEGHTDVATSRFAANWLAWAHFNMACAATVSGDSTLGMDQLKRAVDLGFDDKKRLQVEPELAPLRTRNDWTLLMEKLEPRA